LIGWVAPKPLMAGAKGTRSLLELGNLMVVQGVPGIK